MSSVKIHKISELKTKMKNILLIVSSGKSKRFRGYPKAFFPIGGKMVVENTVNLAKPVFDDIYIAVNEETYVIYKDKIKGCKIFPIATGNGDAHSILKCLYFLRIQENNIAKVIICWGDAYFMNITPFKEAVFCMQKLPNIVPAAVICSIDKDPYAWFEVDGQFVKKTHFAGQDEGVTFGVHDQSLFVLTIDLAVKCLEEYKKELGIEEEYCEEANEMKLLYFFEWLYTKKDISSAVYRVIPPGNVLSFNTPEEAENIKLRVERILKKNSEVL